jgi:two-component system invasion response regulator UvrY
MIRVLLVDDHKLVRTGIRKILEDSAGISVIGEADSGEQGIELARSLKPDVVLLDVSMPGIGGLEATRKLLAIDPTVRIIVVSVHAQEPVPGKLLEAGAYGYLTKGCAADEVVTAVRRVHAGERYLTTEIARALALGAVSGKGGSPVDHLSQREMQVMLMVTQGQSIQEISERLHLSPKTVSTYRYRLFEKLGVHNDVELTRFAIRHGLIESGNAEEV